MLTIEQDYLSRLREQAGRGVAPSQMLRDLLGWLNPEEPRGPVLAWYLMNAFGLELYQVGAVFGWNPEGTGPLDDVRLDELLGRHVWAKAEG